MPYYRLYHLNRDSGHIDRAEDIDAADDVRAVAIVRQRERDTAVELWQRARRVLRLEGSPDVSAKTDGAQFETRLQSGPARRQRVLKGAGHG